MKVTDEMCSVAIEARNAWLEDHPGLALPAMRAAIEAVAPMLVPDGWKLVPCIATGSMMNEGSSYINTHMQDVWKSMLAAAPTPGKSHE